MTVAVLHAKLHLRAFRAANPVALRLLDGVRPVDALQPVEQALGIGRDAQAPLAHLLLHYGIAAALRDAVDHLVVRQHGAQLRAPVHHRFAQVGYAVVHQHLLPALPVHGAPLVGREVQLLGAGRVDALRAVGLEGLHQLADGLGLAATVAVVRVEHPLEGPLRPVVVARVAGAHLAVPVEREAYLVQLFAVAVYVARRRNGGVLARLDGILLGGQAVSVITHRVENVEAAQALVARVDVGSDVAERVPHVKARSRGIGKHVEHVELGPRGILGHVVRLLRRPGLLPFLFYLFEIIVHSLLVCRCFCVRFRPQRY